LGYGVKQSGQKQFINLFLRYLLFVRNDNFACMPVSQNIKVAIDAVVFGYTSREGLSVLLIKRNIPFFKSSTS